MTATAGGEQVAFAPQARFERVTSAFLRKRLFEGSGPTAAWTDPLRDRLRVRALLARTRLLARPARAQPHRPVPAWALFRLEFGLLFRVRHVGDILGKPPVCTYGYVFQSGSACMQGRWPVP
jgi:hypothetical protein